MKRYTILLLLLLILTACGDQPIRLNQVITPEITTETTNLKSEEAVAAAPVAPHGEKLWLITDAWENREALDGQIITISGYMGRSGDVVGEFMTSCWKEPIGNYEDMWKEGNFKNPETPLQKWDTCWNFKDDCWESGQDVFGIRYPSFYPHIRPKGLPVPKPEYMYDAVSGDPPDFRFIPLDKYVVKVFVNHYFYLVDVVDHIPQPREQPPETINDGNPMTVAEFTDRWQEFYGELVSVKVTLTYMHYMPIHILECDGIDLLIPYDEPAYFHKFVEQGLTRWKEHTFRIRVYRPENHTVRLGLHGFWTQDEFPFVLQWVDRKVESE